jgi:hypothetical protein
MATGREMQLTKQVGEYLVAAELCRRGLIATTFTGNVPEFDLLAIDGDYRTQPVQVKAIRHRTWQLQLNHFLDIEVTDDGIQLIHGRKELDKPGMICVFVKLVSLGEDEFYIFRLSDLQELILDGHTKYLEKHGGRRPRNPASMHTAVSTTDLAPFRDNWDVLEN